MFEKNKTASPKAIPYVFTHKLFQRAKKLNKKIPETRTVTRSNIGDFAEGALEKLTQQQFKKDKSAWKKWIEENADEKTTPRKETSSSRHHL